MSVGQTTTVGQLATVMQMVARYTCEAIISTRTCQATFIATEQATHHAEALQPDAEALLCPAMSVQQSSGHIAMAQVLEPGVTVRFGLLCSRLCQQLEWRNGKHVSIAWPNVLPVAWWQELSMAEALQAVSAHPRLPDVCINDCNDR